MASSMVRASTLPSSSTRRFTFSSSGTSKWLLAFSAGAGGSQVTETYTETERHQKDERDPVGEERKRTGERQAKNDGGAFCPGHTALLTSLQLGT